MRILLMESQPGLSSTTAATLEAAGHQVLRCRRPDDPMFPCTDLTDPGSCPLTASGGVDVAVVAHAGGPEPTAAEAGVSCALRQQVPVVAHHEGQGTPFDGWVVPVGEDGVVAACELARRAADAHEVRPLVAEVERLLDAEGVVPAEAEVSIRRDAGRTRIAVVVPAGTTLAPGVIATRVHARLEPRRPAGVVDIAVHSA